MEAKNQCTESEQAETTKKMATSPERLRPLEIRTRVPGTTSNEIEFHSEKPKESTTERIQLEIPTTEYIRRLSLAPNIHPRIGQTSIEEAEQQRLTRKLNKKKTYISRWPLIEQRATLDGFAGEDLNYLQHYRQFLNQNKHGTQASIVETLVWTHFCK